MRKRRPAPIGEVLLSVQRALLSEVLPELRAVAVEQRDGIRLRFIYDCPVDEDLRTITYCVDGEVDADFWQDTTVESGTETQLDGPVELTSTEIPVHLRYEATRRELPGAPHPGGLLEILQNSGSRTASTIRSALGRLAVQSALLGEVTPDLRAVIIDPATGVRVRTVDNRPVDAEIEAAVVRVNAATRANLHLDATVTTHADYAAEGGVPFGEGQWYAYRRNEGEW